MKTVISCVLLIFLCQFSNSQISNTNDDGPAIENSDEFNFQNSSGVDLSTGSFSTTIPLMNLEGGNGSVLNLSLNYQGNKGMKVNDVAGSYGTSFHLQGGGYIKRIVRGVPDEKEVGMVTTSMDLTGMTSPPPTEPGMSAMAAAIHWAQIIYNPNYTPLNENATGWLKNGPNLLFSPYAPLGSPCNSILTYKNAGVGSENSVNAYYKCVYAKGKNQDFAFDGEPDIFEFEFGNYKGKFIFGNDGIPILIPNQDIKILVPTNFDRSTGNGSISNSWIFITNDGKQYEFNNTIDYTEKTLIKYYNPEVHNMPIISTFISQWNLSSVTTSDGNKFNFIYSQPNPIDYYIYKDYIQNWIGGDQPDLYPENFTTTIRTYIYQKKLDRITSDFGYIEFTNTNAPRLDFNNQYTIGLLRKYNMSGDLQNSIILNYDAYLNTNCLNTKRPFLNYIKFENLNGQTQSKIYSFKYNFAPNMPDINSKQTDIYGYWNSNASNNLVPSAGGYQSGGDRSIDALRARVGTLKKIIYPQGGIKEILYEPNNYFDIVSQTNKLTGGVRVAQIIEHPLILGSSDIETNYLYTDESIATHSSGEAIPIRKLFDNQQTLPPIQSLSSYCLVSSDPIREMSSDWIRYNTVIVRNPGNGKKVYKMTGHSSNPDLLPEKYEFQAYQALNTAYSQYFNDKDNDAGAPCIDMSFERGVILNIATFNENGDKIDELINNYNFNPIGFNSKEIVALKINSANEIFRESNECTKYNLEFYKYVSKIYILIGQTHKFYDISNNNLISEIYFYDYNLPVHRYVSQCKKINSDGSFIINKFLYPQDLSSHGLDQGHYSAQDPVTLGIWSLIEKNMLSNPIEVISKYQDQNGIYVTDAEVNQFKQFNWTSQNGQVKLWKKYKLTIDQPISNFSEVQITGSNTFIQDSRYRLIYTNELFDVKGNLVLKTDANNYSTSYFYTNENSKLIGEVENAKIATIAIGNETSYTSFESNLLNESDNWLNNANQTNYSKSLISYNGKYSLKLMSGTGLFKEFRPDNQNQKYRFSCYVLTENGYLNNMATLMIGSKQDNSSYNIFPNTNYSVSNLQLPNTQGHWQYFEVTLDLSKIRSASGLLNSQILRILCTLTNNDPNHYILIDDVRFQPVLSNLLTFTYNNVSNRVSTITNNNNNTLHFNYDGLNNLNYITNNDNNLIIENKMNYDNTNSLVPNNYIITNIFTNPHSPSDLNSGNISLSDKLTTTSYFDGLGRSIQKIFNNFTPNGSDLIQPLIYDSYGRNSKTLLPFTDAISSGSYRTNYENDQLSFYQNNSLIEHSLSPFSESRYDNSPNNIVLEEGNPGQDWTLGSGHTKINSINTNITADNVINWKEENGLINGQNYFADGSLYKITSVDENGFTKEVYKDKIGKTILERRLLRVLGTTGNLYSADETGVANFGFPQCYAKFLDTYYVYDMKGHLVFIIPPAALDQFEVFNNFVFSISDPNFKKFTFSYAYDNRDRCIVRKVPGQEGENYYAYNNANKLVLYQDPNMFDTNKWGFKKYDELGREILNGIFIPATVLSRDQLQININNISYLFENKSDNSVNILNYTNLSFPILTSNYIVHNVTYYDDYNWNLEGRLFVPFGTTNNYNNLSYGLVTGRKSAILEEPFSNNYLTTVNYFDVNDNLIQSHQKHVLGDWDIISNKYSFIKKILNSTRVHNYGGHSTIISTKYLYDHAQRLTDVFKTLSKNNGTSIVADNEIHELVINYDDLGRIVKKSLHYDWAGTSSYLQNIDYRYNIRGWLKSINNSELINDHGISNDDDFDAFGENIFYNYCSSADLNNDEQTIQAIPQYNGNISATKWKIRSPYLLPTKSIEHLYAYRYDELNRLTAGYYASDQNIRGFINTRDNSKNFDEIINYDLMGNIVALKRNNLLGEIDNLTYYYEGNSIINIDDQASLQSALDFHDQSNGYDYAYNKNGSLIQDNNKNINIDYNDINLPKNISSVNGSLDFVYSGSGEKLSRHSGNIFHYYISGIEYEDVGDGAGPKLLFIQTEEGRIRPRSSRTVYPGTNRNFVFDYFLKDHIGNVRAVVSEELTSNSYFATMEPINSLLENKLFNNIDITRSIKPINEPSDPMYSLDDMVSKLGGGSVVGVNKVFKVKQGDNLNINVKYFFDNSSYSNSNYSITDFLTQLAATFVLGGTNSIGPMEESQIRWSQETFINNPGINNFLTSSLQDQAINDPSLPQSYLIYLFFDDKFNFHSDVSGVLQVRDPNVLGDLTALDLKMPANGFFYIYTNNEGSKRVNFNNLSIIHYSGVLLEENHYYPYGLLIEGLTPEASISGDFNKYKFIDREFQNELGLNQYDLGARFYDPAIGRFNVIDPLADLMPNFTSYRYGLDNPVLKSDPTGLWDDEDDRDRDADEDTDPTKGVRMDGLPTYKIDMESPDDRSNIDKINPIEFKELLEDNQEGQIKGEMSSHNESGSKGGDNDEEKQERGDEADADNEDENQAEEELHRDVEAGIRTVALGGTLVEKAIEQTISTGFKYGYRGMEIIETYAKATEKTILNWSKGVAWGSEGTGVVICYVNLYNNPNNVTKGRLVTEIISVALNSVPYIGVVLGASISYANMYGCFDPMYEHPDVILNAICYGNYYMLH